SNRYGLSFGQRWSCLVLVAMTLAGALIRVWFVLRHKGPAPAWVWVAGLAAIAVAAWLIAPKTETAGAPVPLSEVQKVIETRCVACHAQKPSFQGLAEAPKGVMLDTPERIRAQ